MRIVGFATQLPGRLAPDTQAGVGEHTGEHQLQRRIGQTVRQHQPQWRCRHPDQGDEQCRPIAHQAATQTQYRAHGCRQANRQQADRCRLDHRQAKAEHQQGHGKNASAGARQRQHGADDGPQGCAKQLSFDHCPPSATNGCGRASHSRPLSMPCQYSGGRAWALSNQARRLGLRPSSNQLGKLGASLPP